MKTRILISREPFNFSYEYELLNIHDKDGAIVTFVGKVRHYNLENYIVALTLEHYPGMTEKILAEIVENARKRWELHQITIIHRIGKLFPGDEILFVGTSSIHRGNAFAATEFIVDFLKIYAPFWKKESTINNNYWVELRSDDVKAVERWK